MAAAPLAVARSSDASINTYYLNISNCFFIPQLENPEWRHPWPQVIRRTLPAGIAGRLGDDFVLDQVARDARLAMTAVRVQCHLRALTPYLRVRRFLRDRTRITRQIPVSKGEFRDRTSPQFVFDCKYRR